MKTGLKGFIAILSGFIFIAVLWSIVVTNIKEEPIKKPSKGDGMKYNQITTNLMVDSVNETAQFYKDVFGFEILDKVPDSGELAFAIIGRDSVQLMLQTVKSLGDDVPYLSSKDIGGSFTLFIVVEGVDEIYEKAKEHCEILVDMKITFYDMKEFTVKDNNGYVLTFAERVKQD